MNYDETMNWLAKSTIHQVPLKSIHLVFPEDSGFLRVTVHTWAESII